MRLRRWDPEAREYRPYDVPDGWRVGVFDYDGVESVYEVGHAWGPRGELR